MFPESRQMFPESRQMFPESHQMFPESHLSPFAWGKHVARMHPATLWVGATKP
jgi:hypothetical protein